jgi:ribonuclease P protein component
MPHRFGPAIRLRSRNEFQIVQQQGRRVSTRFVILLGYPNKLGRDRLGIIASRRFGNAVVRTRAKRRLREVFRRQDQDEAVSRRPLDVVAIPKRELLAAPFADVQGDFLTALSRLRRIGFEAAC